MHHLLDDKLLFLANELRGFVLRCAGHTVASSWAGSAEKTGDATQGEIVLSFQDRATMYEGWVVSSADRF